jgi:post-segregation antitoxin (ccd killing protein)
MARRPKKRIERESFNTTIDKSLLELLRDLSDESGIPMNRLIENALREKYQKKKKTGAI